MTQKVTPQSVERLPVTCVSETTHVSQIEWSGETMYKIDRDELLAWIAETLARDSVSPSWLGYDQIMGWILLDRLIHGNMNAHGDVLLTFIKLSDLTLVYIKKSVWNSGYVQLYRTFLEKFKKSEFPQECESAIKAHLLVWIEKRTLILDSVNIQVRDSDSEYRSSTDRVSQVAAHLTKEKLSHEFFSPAISNVDISLCLAWSNIRMGPENELLNSLKALGERDACRLISARQAELVTLTYLRKLGRDVSDVSISQLDEKSDQRWKDFDIDAGYPIDVKNARGSYAGNTHFLEHCVARFKADRKTLAEVKIFGVISEYQNKIGYAKDGGTTVTLLGEVDFSSIEKLKQWFFSRFNGMFDLSGLWNEKYLPGWLYEFPEDHYPERAEAKELATELVSRDQPKTPDSKALPGWVPVIAGSIDSARQDVYEPRVQKIIKDLRSLVACNGITLRAIYLYLMGCTLEAVVKGMNPSQTIVDVTEVARFYSRGKESWLGVADPCGYMKALVGVASQLGDNLLASKRKFVAFRLVHPYILKGVEDNGSVLSVVAYCGGWQSDPVVKCAYAPLLIGVHKHCSECGRLVCSECGFCFKSCSKCAPRQTRFIKQRSNIDHEATDFETPVESEDPPGNLPEEYWESLYSSEPQLSK